MDKTPCSGKRHLVLIGLMGSGKSSVGRHLSMITGRPFVDTDAMVEGHERKRVQDIFTEHGEEYFRRLEHDMILQIMQETEPSIVATGGGSIISEANRKLLWSHGWVVYLQAEVSVLLARTSRDASRPLLKTPDPEAKLRELLAARAVWYEQADLICPVRNHTVRELAENILQGWPQT